MASTAARLSAVGDGVLVFQALARGRRGGPAARRVAGPGARRERARTDGLGGLRGRPVGQGRRPVGAAVRRFDAGKKVDCRKRHVVVDTMGLLLLVVITSAGVQDRDGARTLLDRLKMTMPSLSLLWADGGYAGRLVEWADRGRPHHRGDRPQTLGIGISRCYRGGGWSSAPSPGS